MILTDRFVFIHEPKTGGTFVTTVLNRLFAPPPRNLAERAWQWLQEPKLVNVDKHGACHKIPPSHRGLPIVATIRNPYDRYVSSYHFAWWKTKPPEWVDMDEVRRRYPSFPDLTFAEYLEVPLGVMGPPQRLARMRPEDRLGGQSNQFINYFFREPDRVFREIDDEYIAAQRWKQDIYPVRFLKTDRLNQDLHAFLLDMGFPAKDIAFVLEERKIRPKGADSPETPDWSKTKHWSDFYTPELKALVRRRERLLFAVFPEFDV